MKEIICLKGTDITKWRHKCNYYAKTLLQAEYNTSYFVFLLQTARGCYKTRVQTDFGQGQGQLDIDEQYYYQSTTDGEHVTWKSCDISQSSLEQSGRTQGLEGSGRVQRRVRVRNDVKGQEFLMVYTWCTHVQWRLKSMTSRHMYTAWWPQ